MLTASYDSDVNAYVVTPVDFHDFVKRREASRRLLGRRQRAAARSLTLHPSFHHGRAAAPTKVALAHDSDARSGTFAHESAGAPLVPFLRIPIRWPQL